MNYKIKDFSNYISDKMLFEKPVFLGRIGGLEFDVLIQYFYNKNVIGKNKTKENTSREEKYILDICNFCGYFDKNKDKKIRKKNFHRFLKELLISYRCMTDYTYIGRNIEVAIETNKKSIEIEYFLKNYVEKKNHCNYKFIKNIYPFLGSFSKFAKNKKILIISPFSEIIKEQLQRKNLLIKNYDYPEFELITYTTPITYNDGEEDLPFIYTNSWLEQNKVMCDDINKLEFDIALLSCGTYGMTIGKHIYLNMKKKAVYIGGISSVLFNIYGKKYDTPIFNDIKNPETQIKFQPPIYKEIKGGRQENLRAFNAYF